MEVSKKLRKVMCLNQGDPLDKAIYVCLVQMSQNMPISWTVLCEKAAKLHKKLHEGEAVLSGLVEDGCGISPPASWFTPSNAARQKILI